MYYVYIIQSVRNNKIYKGSTANLIQRVKEHNSGKVKTTKANIPFALKWYCRFVNKKMVLDFEKYLKTGSGIAFSNKHLFDQTKSS